jgi:hypothetical protein
VKKAIYFGSMMGNKSINGCGGVSSDNLSSSSSLQVWWAKVKDFSSHMCLRWWYFVSRLLPTYVGLDFKFKLELELVVMSILMITSSSSGLNLKSQFKIRRNQAPPSLTHTKAQILLHWPTKFTSLSLSLSSVWLTLHPF